VQLIDFLQNEKGSAARLAALLGLSPSYLSQMATGYRAVSPARCAAIERATNGQVTRKDLRPGDWHLIWPELVESEASNGAISRHELRPDSFGAINEHREAAHG